MMTLDDLKKMEHLGSKGVLERILGEDIQITSHFAVKITGVYIDEINHSGTIYPIRVADGYVYPSDNPEKSGESKIFAYTDPTLFYFQLVNSIDSYMKKGH